MSNERQSGQGQFLSGVRVIDFSHLYAGPYCAMMLAVLGAEVIKVESLRHPDMMRRRMPSGGHVKWVMSGDWTPEDLSRSFYFDADNLSKRSVAINLAHKQGAELARRLVAVSDVVVSAFRPGVMEKLGLGYGALKALREDLIMVAISGMGQRGPEAQYASYASIFAALGGLSYITGYKDGIPTEIRASMDHTVGTTAALAVMAALCYRQRTGNGQFIDLSSQESIAVLIGDVLLDYGMNRRVAQRQGNDDAGWAPHGCYRCTGENRWIALAATTEGEWRSLCQVMGNPAWSAEERFSSALRRWQRRRELDDLIEQWTSQWDDGELAVRLQGAGVPATPVMSSKDLFEHSHLQERGAWVSLRHPLLGGLHQVGLPWKFSRTALTYAASPVLGADDEYVFRELLGLSSAEERALREQGAIR